MKHESWHTKAKDRTPSPTNIVSKCIVEWVTTWYHPPDSSTDSLTGAQTAMIITIIVSNTAEITDVLDKFAISLCIDSGSVTPILHTTKIPRRTGSLSAATPHSDGIVSLIIIK
mmetsp:Transcript_29336/g.35737  ORF Transcript_29336/g.35737 Transcript_29336/m.35737 type:complete len:114 (+) Transcript_29336:3-344(+)